MLAEACARLAFFDLDQGLVVDLVKRKALRSAFDSNRAADRLSALLWKYADRPMDFADACLVVMSEQTADCVVVTTDAKDFSVYRRHDRHVIPFRAPR